MIAGWLAGLVGAERRGHVVSTAHLMAAYPFTAQAALGALGVLVGVNVYGGDFALDPWELYRLRLLRDPNMIILGSKGAGKSALLKDWALRQRVFGRRIEMFDGGADGRSENGPVVAAMGGVTLRLAPGCGVNPLERVGSREGRLSLLRAIARTLLDRKLAPVEKAGLTAALDAADRAIDGEVTIPDVVERLRDPDKAMAGELLLSAGPAREELREVGYVLRDLSTGPLAGMFDQPTSVDFDWRNPVINIDLSAIEESAHGEDKSAAFAIALVACTAFLDARRRARGGDEKTIRFNDEAWHVLSVPGAAEYYNSSLKLSRKNGVSYVSALHRLSDLSSTGDAGTRQQRLAEGVAAECATRVLYRTEPTEVDATARALRLTSTQRDLLSVLGDGEALWTVGDQVFRVQHQIAPSAWPLLQTDEGMGGRR